MNELYWASLGPEECAAEVVRRVEAYRNWILNTGRLARWRMAHDTYYGNRGSHKSYQVQSAGEKGELSFVMDNEYRNLVQHLLVLATQSRPALECTATNSDVESQAQTVIGKGILEYYRKQAKMDRKLRLTAEISLVMDHAWLFNEWDTARGEPDAVDEESGAVIRKGDVFSRARTPLHVAYDFTNSDPEDQDWRVVIDPVNKYDLAAQYPEKAREILACKRDQTKDALFRFGDTLLDAGEVGAEDSRLDLMTLYHRRSPACESGRMLQVINGKLWLFDGPLPYRDLPGRRCCPTEMILSSAGYANTNDLIGLQDCVDALVSAAVTNCTTTGVNLLWSEPGGDFDYEQLTQGMSLIESTTRPEVLQLYGVKPEMFTLLNFLISRMEALSGVNQVARGQVSDKNMSGAAMALLQSLSIQFASGLQQAYFQLVEDAGNDVIWMLQEFGNTERIATIAGNANKWMVKKFSSKDLKSIHRVFAVATNPLAQTTSGKLTIAQDMIKMSAIKTPDQYLQVLETGSLEPLIEDDRNDLLTIREENEAMSRGEVPPVMLTDIHPRHFLGHRPVVGNPESRKDPKVVAAYQKHQQQHIDLIKSTDPAVLMLLGIDPALAGIPPGPPGGAPDGGTGAVGAPSEPPSVPGPSMPTNPLTGEQWNPQDGGLS